MRRTDGEFQRLVERKYFKDNYNCSGTVGERQWGGEHTNLAHDYLSLSPSVSCKSNSYLVNHSLHFQYSYLLSHINWDSLKPASSNCHTRTFTSYLTFQVN